MGQNQDWYISGREEGKGRWEEGRGWGGAGGGGGSNL